MRRREFLAGLAGISAIKLLAGCATARPKIPTVPAGPTAEVLSAEIQKPAREKLLQAITGLPEIPTKTLLTERVLPYFQEFPPSSKNFSEIEVKVYNPTAVSKLVDKNIVGGTYSAKDTNFPVDNPLFPIDNTTLTIPYVGLIVPGEKINDQFSKAADGTSIVNVQFPSNRAFYEGIAPEIAIYLPRSGKVTNGSVQTIEQFMYVKEACTMLLEDLWVQEVIKKMKDLCFSTHIPAQKSDGSLITGEAIMHSVGILVNRNGRLAGTNDLAGYIVALKAFENTQMWDDLMKDYDFQKVMPSIKDLNLGQNGKEIMVNSYNFVLNSKIAQNSLVAIGNLNQIP